MCRCKCMIVSLSWKNMRFLLVSNGMECAFKFVRETMNN